MVVVDPYEHATNIHVGPICHPPEFTGYGSTDSGIVFIGIAPGRDEVKTGRPFTGPSGKLLNSYLDAIGIPRASVYCTNLICWWKDDPTYDEYLKCRDRLLVELKAIKPKIIVLMGAIVTDYVLKTKLAGVSGSRGSVTWNKEFNAYVMPTYHPAAVLRSGGKESVGGDKGANVAMDIWRDMSKLADVLTWPRDDSLQHVPYRVVESVDEAQTVLDNLPHKNTCIPVAVDVETSSIDEDEMDFTADQLLCLSVATPDYSWVFPKAVLEQGALQWPLDKCMWTFHNALFDTQVIKEHLGFWMPVVEDTMLQSYSLDERPGYHRLKPLAREYNGSGWWEVDRKALKGKLHTIPPAVLHKYNAYDGGNTARLQIKLRAKQDADHVREMYEQILIPSVNTFNRVQYDGVLINFNQLMGYALKWGMEVQRREAELQEKAFEWGWPRENGVINLNSPKQLSTLLYGVLSLPIDPYKKKESTDKLNLERLSGLHPFVDELGEFRHWEHNYNTYIEGLNNHIKKDGRAHAIVKLHGTVTGRLSYTKPPLQTIPRPYDGDTSWELAFRNLRNLFIPNSDDHVVIEADFGKAEIWMAAWYSGDKQIEADLLSGDYHTVVSMDVLNKQKHEVTKDDRTAMKRVTFGIMYGREAQSLSQAIKRTVTEAAAYISGFFQRNSTYAQFLRKTQNDAIDNGELTTVTGRKRRFMFLGAGWDARALKQAINYPIQSTTSDYTLMSVVDLYPLIKPYGAYIMLSVHDSIVVGCPKEHVEVVTRIVHDVMTKQRWFGCLPVEIKVGRNWGKAKPVHSCEDATACQEARRDGVVDYTPTFNFKPVGKLLRASEDVAA